MPADEKTEASGEAQKELEGVKQAANDLYDDLFLDPSFATCAEDDETTRKIIECIHLRMRQALAASQGVSAPAVAEIEEEMRQLIVEAGESHIFHMSGDMVGRLSKWADRLAALRGEQK